jgi:hypothetical protein
MQRVEYLTRISVHSLPAIFPARHWLLARFFPTTEPFITRTRRPAPSLHRRESGSSLRQGQEPVGETSLAFPPTALSQVSARWLRRLAPQSLGGASRPARLGIGVRSLYLMCARLRRWAAFHAADALSTRLSCLAHPMRRGAANTNIGPMSVGHDYDHLDA